MGEEKERDKEREKDRERQRERDRDRERGDMHRVTCQDIMNIEMNCFSWF